MNASVRLATVSLVLATAACASAPGSGSGDDEPIASEAAADPFGLAASRVGAGSAHEVPALPPLTNAEVQTQDMWKQLAIVQDGSVASRATGSLEVPIRGANGQPLFVASAGGSLAVRGTCGVTFISPHFAVTAAHCVESTNVPDPANDTLVVRTYDVTAASPLGLAVSALIKGTFPSYLPLTTSASGVAGYESQAFSCKVAARCEYGSYNCGFAADVAMLDCPTRASNAAWLPVASSDPGTGPVEMYWFHELLSMPVEQPAAGAPAVDFDRFAHYTAYIPSGTSSMAGNWHYIAGPTNALLPLKLIPWSNGAARRRLGGTATDLFGCHGTSGSGVLQRNAAGNLELLGPVKDGASWASSRLCNDPDTFQPGQLGLTYEPNTSTNMLQSQFGRVLFFDRNRISVLPSVGVVLAR